MIPSSLTHTPRYPYLTHLVLNAGGGPFTGLDWAKVRWELVKNPIIAVTQPSYNIEEKGRMTEDGLGWTWQVNILGHYVLVRVCVGPRPPSFSVIY
jgi:3-keto steroid reductase